jgi:hypothetical protein
MTAQIINLADYRKAKEAEQVRKVVNDYFAAHSQIMAWWLSGDSRRLIAGTAMVGFYGGARSCAAPRQAGCREDHIAHRLVVADVSGAAADMFLQRREW